MYIATYRFDVPLENIELFEQSWNLRPKSFKNAPGFLGFQLFRGPESEDGVLYVSHLTWESEEAFHDWNMSDRKAATHQRDPNEPPRVKPFRNKPVMEGFQLLPITV